MDSFSKNFGQIVEKAWNDEAFKQRLVARPVEVLKEHGIDLPAGVNVNVVENTDNVRYFVLPQPPGQLSEADLEKVAGGATGYTDYPDQGSRGGRGAGGIDDPGTLFAPPTGTDFSTASNLGVAGSSYKLDK